MGQLTPFPLQEFDDNGEVLSGGKLYTYEAGTSTPKTTYADADETTPNANPVVLDASGRATVFLAQGSYKLVLKNSSDTIIWQVDDIFVSGAGLGTVSVVDTIADLRALAAGAYDAVLVMGYNSRNDRGGGWFGWDATSSASDDYGVYIQPDSAPSSGRWVRKYTKLDVRYFGAYGDGVENDTAAFGYADDYAATLGDSILVSEGNYLLSTDPGLVSPVEFAVDGKLTWSGYQPAMTPIFDQDDISQHFSCVAADAPELTELLMVRPEWFGATANGTTDDSVAIQSAIASIPDQKGVTISLQPGLTYAVADASGFAFTSRSGIILDGRAAYFKKITNAGPVLQITACTHITINNLRIDGNSLATFGIDIQEDGSDNDCESLILNDIYIDDCTVAVRLGQYSADNTKEYAIVDSTFNVIEVENCDTALQVNAPEIDNVEVNNFRVNCDAASQYIQIAYGHVRINDLVMVGNATARAEAAIYIQNGSLYLDGANITFTNTKQGIVELDTVTAAYGTAYPNDVRATVLNRVKYVGPGAATGTGYVLGTMISAKSQCRALTMTNCEWITRSTDTAGDPLRVSSTSGYIISENNLYLVGSSTKTTFYVDGSGYPKITYLRSKNDTLSYWSGTTLVKIRCPDRLVHLFSTPGDRLELVQPTTDDQGHYIAWWEHGGSGTRFAQGRLGFKSDSGLDPTFQVNVTESGGGDDQTAMTIDYNLRTTLYGRLDQTASSKAAAGSFVMPEANTAFVSGTTQINSISAAGWTPGSLINLRFDSTTVVSGTGNIRLDKSSNDATHLPGSTMQLLYDGSLFRETTPDRIRTGQADWSAAVVAGLTYNALDVSPTGNYIDYSASSGTTPFISHIQTTGWHPGDILTIYKNEIVSTFVHDDSDTATGYGKMQITDKANVSTAGAFQFVLTPRYIWTETDYRV